MIRKHCPQPHRPRMQYRLMTKAAEASMTVNNLNPLPQDNVAKDWKERKDRRHRRFSVDDEEWNMVDLEAIGQITDTSATFVGVCNNDDLVPAIDQLGG